MSNESNKKREEFLNKLENNRPQDTIMEMAKYVSKSDFNTVKEIQEEHKLTKPVTNALIHYTLVKNDFKLHKNFMNKWAEHMFNIKAKTAMDAIEQIQIHERSLRKQKNKEEEKPFTVDEYKFMESLFDNHGLNLSIGREIIRYGREINQNNLINWFVDAVADYIKRNKGETVEDTEKLIEVFHKKYVVNFGKD